MSANFDLIDLYKHYSKNIISERQENVIAEKEYEGPIAQLNSNKFKAILYYDDDPKLIPDSFQIDYFFNVVFNVQKIAEDFSSEQVNFDSDVNIDDDEIDKMIAKKMQGSQQQKVKKAVINTENFYYDFFKKNLTSYVVENKLNDLIRAGIIPIENWKIYAVTYSGQVDDKLLFRKVEDGIKKNKVVIPAKYGYQIAFTSTNKMQKYGLDAVTQFSQEFSKALETTILKDTKYYKIIK